MSALVVGGITLVGAFVAKNAALKTLAITVGKGAVELPGELAGMALSARAREYLEWRPHADSNSLRDQIASVGLQSAEDHLAQFDSTGNKQWLFEALKSLISASDQLRHADVQNDDKMWLHSIHVHHLLVVVAYLHASDMGNDCWAGMRSAERYLKRMLGIFHLKYKAARGALFNKATKMENVKAQYSEHMLEWVQRLHCAVQEQAGRFAVTTTTCTESGMIVDVAFTFTPALSDLVRCAQCLGGFVFNGTCSNPGCHGFVPAIGELASTVHGGVHGRLAVQVDGKGEFWGRYAQLAGGVLTLFEMPGGPMVSQATVGAGQTITVRAPKTARVGRPHCLRIELPNPDSTGQSKYIIDPTSSDNRTRWSNAFLGRAPPPSIVADARANARGVAITFPPAQIPHQSVFEAEPEPELEVARSYSRGGTPVRWEWQDTTSGRWTPFSDLITTEIEAASVAGIRSVDVARDHPRCFVDPAPHRLAMKSWDDPTVVKAPIRRVVDGPIVPTDGTKPNEPEPQREEMQPAAVATWHERQQLEAAIAAVAACIAAEQEECRRIEQERQRVADASRAERLLEKIAEKEATRAYLRTDGQDTRIVTEGIDGHIQELLALPNWERAVDAAGRTYFIDHNKQQTHWAPPADQHASW